MTMALPDDKISKKGKFTVSQVFHCKGSKQMLALTFSNNRFVVTWKSMGRSLLWGMFWVGRLAYFRRDRQLSERHSQALRRHANGC